MLNQVERGGADALDRLRTYIVEGGYAFRGQVAAGTRSSSTSSASAAGRCAARSTRWSGRARSGGMWVRAPLSPGEASSDPVLDLGRQMTPMRMVQARLCIEPALAREAAVHATGGAMESLTRIVERAEAASSWAEYEAQDDAFHRTVAEAADNVFLSDVFDRLNRVRRAVTWSAVARRSARPAPDHSSFAEHRAVLSAIGARDADAAWEAMRVHLGSVSARLFP